jgi:hypothetical protein
MHTHPTFRSATVCSLFVVLALACADDKAEAENDAGVCPSGPSAPRGGRCDTPGLVCTYGYQNRACGGRTMQCTDATWTEVTHTDPGASCDAGVSDAGNAPRAPALEGVTGVAVSRFYCGLRPSSCGAGTIAYSVDLVAATLTTTRCTASDAGPAERPMTSLPLSAEQVSQVRTALAAIRVVDAKLSSFDGAMQDLTLTAEDGSTRRFSPAAACGEPDYTQVVQGYAPLWDLIVRFDPEP